MNSAHQIYFCLVLLLTASCSTAPHPPQPKAVEGVLDLSHFRLIRDGPVRLNGEWEFFWNQLLDPEELAHLARSGSKHYIPMPGTWRGQPWEGKSLPGHGFATFRLRILLPHPHLRFGLKIDSVGTAYRLWANGELVAKNGVVGKSETQMKPYFHPLAFFATAKNGRVDLVMQISNFYDRHGGIWTSPDFGTDFQIMSKKKLMAGIDFFLLGVLLIMAFYHLGLYLLRRKEPSTLLFGLMCLSIALRTGLTNEKLFYAFFPLGAWTVLFKVEYLTILLGSAFTIWFLHTIFQKTLGRHVLRAYFFVAILIGLFILLTPPPIFTEFLLVVHIIPFVSVFLGSYILVVAISRKMEGAIVATFGGAALAVSVIFDIVVANTTIDAFFITPIGISLVVFAQSSILSIKFSKAFSTAERLSENLQQEVDLRTAELLKQTESEKAARIEAQEAKQQAEEARTRLEQAYELLAEHDRLKSRFFANVSHEIRTPLTLILTPLERLLELEEDKVPAELRDRHRSMAANAQRLLRLVNQILDFARIESNATTISYECRNIHEIAQAMLQGFEAFARSKGLTLKLVCPEEPPEIYIDPEKIDKVLCNLLSNACKFTAAGGSVTISITHDETMVFLAVTDTGIGLAKKDLPKLFRRFNQVDGGSSRRYEGTGIGLAFSKELVELCGGKIEVQSELGKGSTFTVKLPIGTNHIKDNAQIRQSSSDSKSFRQAQATSMAIAAEEGLDTSRLPIGQTAFQSTIPSQTSAPPPDDKEAKAPTNATGTTGEIDGSATGDASTNERPLVLVVEDNPDMRSLIKEICEEEFRVIEAPDGEKGLALAKKEHPILIISDVMMPVMDGYGLLQRLRQDPHIASTPLMLLTAKAETNMKIEGLEKGADDYLAKPFESRELLARARNLIRLQETERKLKDWNRKLQLEVMNQSTALQRMHVLQQFLPPHVAKKILEEGEETQLGQKRLPLTAFRMELRGFEHLSGATDPEDLLTMLNSYFSMVVETAFAFGATVDKFLQETVIGFVGAPTSQGPKEDALCCAKMAIELHRKAVEKCSGWQEFLQGSPPIPTIAFSSGYATVGTFGAANRLEYTAIGGAVDDARVLLSATSPGDVVCNQRTMAFIKDHIDCTFQRDISLPTRSIPIKAYQLQGTSIASLNINMFEAPTMNPADSRSNFSSSHSLGQASSSSSIFKPSVSHAQNTPVANTHPIDLGAQTLEPGFLMNNRFKIISHLGTGSMGAVYKAEDLKLSSIVALKMVRADPSGDPVRLKRFYREVKLVRLINHYNVARIYDLSEWQNFEFITMEYIDGQTLADHLRKTSCLDIEEAKKVFLQLCAGLAAAHVAGIVHRDLKPANVILEKGGRAVILDFGIARWQFEQQVGSTETCGAIGTPYYMAPEQFIESKVDHRADIYALGVLAYEMFAGKRPFDGNNIATIAYKHTRESPPDISEQRPVIPDRIVAVIMRCLEKDPQKRFNSATEIGSMLGDVT